MGYVYVETENWIEDGVRHHLYTVGFYRPDGKFEPESDHADKGAAAARVHYLNGGHHNPDCVDIEPGPPGVLIKFCVKCGDPMMDSVTDIVDAERCYCCSDDQDPLDCVKQEAFVAGWAAALESTGA